MRWSSGPQSGASSESDVVHHKNNQSQAKYSQEYQSYHYFSFTPAAGLWGEEIEKESTAWTFEDTTWHCDIVLTHQKFRDLGGLIGASTKL